VQSISLTFTSKHDCFHENTNYEGYFSLHI